MKDTPQIHIFCLQNAYSDLKETLKAKKISPINHSSSLTENGESHSVLLGPIDRQSLSSLQELDLEVTPIISSDGFTQSRSTQTSKSFVITLFCEEYSAQAVTSLIQLLRSYEVKLNGVTRIERCTGLQFWFDAKQLDQQTLRSALQTLSKETATDLVLQEDDKYRADRKMVFFDMDSTLIKAEVIDELAKRAGVGEQVSAITESAMRGEIDFKQSFTERMKLLKGLNEEVLDEIAEELPIMDGAQALFENLQLKGYKTAILSGGFTFFAEVLQKQLGIDYVIANQLEVNDHKLTGEAIDPVIDASEKQKMLMIIAAKEGIDIEQTVAVGDGANDLPMLATAGLGIAFKAKPVVQHQAKAALSVHGLDAILYLLGFSETDIH